jgi:diguanylate cyclase (GGDEF)-like protein/PAS domain S-box-containing protein
MSCSKAGAFFERWFFTPNRIANRYDHGGLISLLTAGHDSGELFDRNEPIANALSRGSRMSRKPRANSDPADALKASLKPGSEPGSGSTDSGHLDTLEPAYRALVDAIQGVVWEVHGPDWTSTKVGPQVRVMFGYAPEVWHEPAFWEAHVHPDDRARAVLAYETAILERRSYQSEYRFMAGDGSTVWVRDIGTVVQTGDSFHIRGVMLDINVDRKARILEQDRNDVLELVARNAPLEVILERLMGLIATQQPEAVCSVSLLESSPEGAHLRLRAAQTSLTRALRSALRLLPLGPIGGPVGLAASLAEAVVLPDLNRLETVDLDGLLLLPIDWEAGRQIALERGLLACWAFPILGAEGQILGVIASHRSKTGSPDFLQSSLYHTVTSLAAIALEHRSMNERIRVQARIDALTGLPNRLALEDRLTQAILEAGQRGSELALLWVDLDGFKTVNDTLGHAVGDGLLQAITDRMLISIGSGDTLARIGGDEFALVHSLAKGPEDAARLAERLLESFRAPIEIQGRELFVTGSIGIALYPQDGLDTLSLQRHADLAMYRAKAAGKNTFELFTPALTAVALERLELEHALRRALENAQTIGPIHDPSQTLGLELHYQPQVDLKGQVVAVEALLRWNHPQLGPIPPVRFIPVAEDCGLIVALGEWVLSSACHQVMRWRVQGLTCVPVAVNVSPIQFSRSDFVQTVQRVLHTSGLEASFLELELTEGIVMQDLEATSHKLFALREMGVSVSIDDFGTGYSSLKYLQRLPIDCLKIDRSFVLEIDHEFGSQSLVRTIILLARELGLKVVAEGVETDAQFDIVRALECDRVQGYLFARPVSALNLEPFLRLN